MQGQATKEIAKQRVCTIDAHGTQSSDVRYALIFCTIGKCNSTHI